MCIFCWFSLYILQIGECVRVSSLIRARGGAVGWGTALQAGRNFSLTSFQPHYGPEVDSASYRNEYQEYFLGGKGGRCVELTLPPSCVNCLETKEPQTPGTLRACPGLYRKCFTFMFDRYYLSFVRMHCMFPS